MSCNSPESRPDWKAYVLRELGQDAQRQADAHLATCSTCTIQSKKATKDGKFEYKMSCIHDTSGDEIMNTVTAAKDADAMKLAKGKCP